MKELPPTIEMSGCNQEPSKYNVQPSIINGVMIGNNPINDMIDGYEVVYDDNFKIEQHVNDPNYNYYDPAFPMITGNEYGQNDNVFNINTNYSQNNYPQIVNDNNNNNNMNNNNNNCNNNNNHSSIDDQIIPNLPSIRASNSNIQRVQIQPPYTPPYPNQCNLVTVPGLNQQQEYNSNNNDGTHNQRLQYQQQINLTPETTLTGQISSSSSSSSDGNSLSSSYAPSRGTNSSYNVSRNRYSPLSVPNTSNVPNTPNTSNAPIIISRNNNNINDNNDIINNSNNSNYNHNDHHRMIDQYQIAPFSPSYDNRNDNNNQFAYNQGPTQQQIGFNDINDINNMNMVNIDNNHNTNMIENGAFMMNMNNNNNNHNNYGNNINDNFVFTNLSNISSPTPLLGGFL